MTETVFITHACSVDAVGLQSSTGLHRRWSDLDLDPAQGQIRWRPVFGTVHQGFRRMDLLSRMLVVAAEACGLDTLSPETRTNTALVFASSTGCLAADLRFEASLHRTAGIEPALFPYTLPSTALGEVAIRHRLQGPSLCLPVATDQEHRGVQTAAQLIEDDEAAAAVVLLGDWLPADSAARVGIEAKTHLAALLLQVPGADTPRVAATEAATPSTMKWLPQALEQPRTPPWIS